MPEFYSFARGDTLHHAELARLGASAWNAWIGQDGVYEPKIDAWPSGRAMLRQADLAGARHASTDHAFAKRLHAGLQEAGVRCWFAPDSMMIGDRIRDRIEQSIRVYDKVIVVVSAGSIQSDWVEAEVEAALEKERLSNAGLADGYRVAVGTAGRAWARTVARSRHIGDFTAWKDHDSYTASFDRLLRDLRSAVS